MVILLEPEVWNEEIVSKLVNMGHTVRAVARTEYNLIIGPRAWRLPKDKTSLKDIVSVVKQAAKIIKAETTKGYATLSIPLEVADGMEDQTIPEQETDGQAAERVITAYRPAKRKGAAKRRAKVSRGTDDSTSPGCDDAGC